MDITVQWIKTSWTKQSRGGEAAARRNAAPVSFSLPQVPSGFAHFVQMPERDGFEPRSSLKDLCEIGVSLRDESDQLRVLARVEPFFGLPPRPRRPPAMSSTGSATSGRCWSWWSCRRACAAFELQRAIPGISQRMLTLTTKRLCRDGLVERRAYPTIPPQVDYRLTEMGRSLADTVFRLAGWSRDHMSAITAARSTLDTEHANEGTVLR